MKNLNLLIKNPVFWLIIYSIIITVLFIFCISSDCDCDCEEIITDPVTEKELNELTNKSNILKYEISKDSLFIWNADNDKLDSLRAIYFQRYTSGK